MCNRVVQNDIEVKPGRRATVLIRGPQGEFELPFTEAIFGGPAKRETRNYWIKKEGAEEVTVPNVSKFGEKNKTTGEQVWEDMPSGSALQGLFLTQPPGKQYWLLKIVTHPPPGSKSHGSEITVLRSLSRQSCPQSQRQQPKVGNSLAVQRRP